MDSSCYPLLVLARHTSSPRPYCVFSLVPDVTASTLLVQEGAWSAGSHDDVIPLTRLYQQKYHLQADPSQRVLIASARPAPLRPGKCKTPAPKSAVYLLPQYVQLHPLEDGDSQTKHELQHAVPWGLVGLARGVAIGHVCDACGAPGADRMMAEALTAYDGINTRLAWLGDAFWRVLVTDRLYWSNEYQAEAFVELCDRHPFLANATLFEPLALVAPKNAQAVRNKRYADVFEAIIGAVGIHHYRRSRAVGKTLSQLHQVKHFLAPEVDENDTVKGPGTREWLNLERSLTVWEESPEGSSLGDMNDRRNSLYRASSNSPL